VTARDTARDLAVLKVLGERLKGAKAALDRQARELMEPSDRSAVKLDGELVGTVTLAEGRSTAKVTDPRELLAWVKEHYPTEVVTVEQIRPAFLAKLLDVAKDAGFGVVPETGDVVPGIDVGAGDPYPMVRLTADADAVVEVAWRAGRLPLPGGFLPALDAGGDG
jgi:hypothetical protein